MGGTLSLFLLHIVAARYLGAEDYGRFSFALAFTYLFMPILDPGLYYFFIRELARRKELTHEYLSHALSWTLFAAPLALSAIYIGVNLIHDSQRTLDTVYIIAASMVLNATKSLFVPVLVAHERFGLNAISTLIERLSLLILSSLALVMGMGLIGVCWAFIVVRTYDVAIIATIVWRKICHFRLGHDIAFTKTLLMSSLPIGAFHITLAFYNYIDTVMISAFRDTVEVGWYGAAYKLYEGFMILPVILSTVFMPRISRLHLEDRIALKTLASGGLKYVIYGALLIATNGIVFANEIITFFFGQDFVNSVLALRILLAGVVFAFIINYIQTVLISVDQQKLVFYVAVLGLVANIGLNAVLVPTLGYLGAAIATVTVEMLIFLILVIYYSKIIGTTDSIFIFGLPLFFAVIFGILILANWSVHIDYIIAGAINLILVYSVYLLTTQQRSTS